MVSNKDSEFIGTKRELEELVDVLKKTKIKITNRK